MFVEEYIAAKSANVAETYSAESIRHYRGVIVRESESQFPADRVCFLCGGDDDPEPLVGSSPLCDWVHPGCLKQPIVWD